MFISYPQKRASLRFEGITREQALTESEFHSNGDCDLTVGPRGGVKVSMTVWRVNGARMEWKRNDNVRVPLKSGFGYGRGSYGYLEWPNNAAYFHTRAQCPVIKITQAEDCTIGEGEHAKCKQSFCMVEYTKQKESK